MKLWLSYTFEDKCTLPIYDGSQLPHEPVAVEWLPSIYCDSESVNRGGYYDELPLPRANIYEIHVESMRSYHLLCRREEAKDFSGLVRILPPVPERKPLNNKPWLVCLVSERDEYPIASSIASKFGGSVIHINSITPEILSEVGCLVLPQIKSATSAFLCAGINEGCRIVASDAGANEEYLTKYGRSWHIVRKRKKDHFIGAINDLYGVGDWMQLPYCDDAPYE